MSHLTVQQLSSSLDGAITGPSLELIVRHLAGCAECRDRQSRLARHDDVLRRLLAPEASADFLETLGSRGEDIAVAIARGVPPPEMTTSVPLLDDEDPHAPSEPRPRERPELGRSGQLAQEAGFGRIGVKPTAPAQVPESDPEEAKRLLEALEKGVPEDADARTVLPQAHEKPEPDGPGFDLPAWIKERASRPRPMPVKPREVQKLKLVFDPEPEMGVAEPERAGVAEPEPAGEPEAIEANAAEPKPAEPNAAKAHAPRFPWFAKPKPAPAPESVVAPAPAPVQEPEPQVARAPAAEPVEEPEPSPAPRPEPSYPNWAVPRLARDPVPTFARAPEPQPMREPAPTYAQVPPPQPETDPQPKYSRIPELPGFARAPRPIEQMEEEPMTPQPRGGEPTHRAGPGEPYRGSVPYEPTPSYPPSAYEPASGTYDEAFDTGEDPDSYADAFAEDDAYGAGEPVYATRESARAAALRRSREEARRRGLRVHWFLAGGSVGTLLLVVAALQLMPVTREGDRVASRFRLPRIELVRRDSSAVPARGNGVPELHSATTPAPVESVVPPAPREVPQDSSAMAPEDTSADSTSGVPGR